LLSAVPVGAATRQMLSAPISGDFYSHIRYLV
jgi:hypothetical protein